AEPRDSSTPDPAPAAGTSLLDQIIAQGRPNFDEARRREVHESIRELVDQVMAGTIAVSPDTYAMINNRIGRIDALLTRQLDAILHHPDFQKLEATWRGLHYLVRESETSSMLRIRVLDVSKRELQEDMNEAGESDKSVLFKKVYVDEYSILGGAPYGALVGD